MKVSSHFVVFSFFLSVLSGCGTLSHAPDASTEDMTSKTAPSKAEPKAKQEVAKTTAPKPEAVKEEKAEVIPLPETKVESKSAELPKTAQEAPALELPKDPNTFLITIATKNPTHPHFGEGHQMGFVVNGKQGQALVMKRGDIYRFDVRTDVKHDFYLSTNPVGWGAAVFTDGVRGYFTYKGLVEFKPDSNTPDMVYYQCRNHKSMGGPIYIVNSDAEAAALRKKLAAEQSQREKNADAQKANVDEAAVKQKIAYGQMLVKIKGKQLDAAQLKRAEEQLAAAQAALDKGDHGSAYEAANQAVEQLKSATENRPSAETVAELKQTYAERLESVHSFEKSHEATYARAKKGGGKAVDYNKQAVKGLLDDAAKLASNEKYDEALQSLAAAQRLITTAINDMLHEQTLVYDKNFETPKEEYEYELGRFDSYEELVPVAIEQKQPNSGQLKLMETYVNKGKGLREQATQKAKEGDYKTAILMLQAGTENVQRGLRLLGVSM